MKTSLMLAALAACAIASPAVAQSADAGAPAVDVNATLLGGSDYVWRGLTQTDGGPAAFAMITATSGGFYAGVGTENVNFSGIKHEYDAWGGYVFDLGKAKLDLGLSFYGYVDAPTNIDTLEFKAALSSSTGNLSYGAVTYYTRNYFGSGGYGLYGEVNAAYQLTPALVASAVFGHQKLEKLPDYNTWNLGATYELVKNVKLDVRYHDTDTDRLAYGTVGKARVVGTLSFGF